MINKWRNAIIGLVMMVVLSVVSFACAKPTTESNLMTLATYATGTNASNMGVGIIDAAKQLEDLEIRVQPLTTDRAKLTSVLAGQAQAMVLSTGEALGLYQGGVALSDLGPQPLRLINLGGPTSMCGAMRGDSGIKTCADLKGKRWAIVPGHTSYALFTTFVLNYC